MNKIDSTSNEITLKELISKSIEWFSYLLTKWKVLLISGILGAALGLVTALLKRPVYIAELTFALEEKGGVSSYAGLASQLGLDMGSTGGGGAFVGENSIELMKSRRLIEKALLTAVEINGKRDLLVNRYIDFNELREKWQEKRPDLAAIRFVEDEKRSDFGILKDSLLSSIYKKIRTRDLTVERIDKKLSIIKVKVVSDDESFAKYFTEVLVNATSEFYILTKTQKSKRNLEILESRLDSIKRQLDINIYGAASTKDQNVNVVRAKGNITSAKKQLNVQILTTTYGELIKNTELAKYTLMREEPLIQVIDSPVFPLEKASLGKINGLVIGGILGVMVVALLLIMKRIVFLIMKN